MGSPCLVPCRPPKAKRDAAGQKPVMAVQACSRGYVPWMAVKRRRRLAGRKRDTWQHALRVLPRLAVMGDSRSCPLRDPAVRKPPPRRYFGNRA
jgi:hypothetical protein